MTSDDDPFEGPPTVREDPNAKAPRDLVVGRYQGPSSAAPYPLSRMAPAFDLVDVAKEIRNADRTIATMTTGKLRLLAEQMRALQEKARSLLEKAHVDAQLHRAKCNFQKTPGQIYHVYENEDFTRWFSLFGPHEWRTGAPHGYVGSFRLEYDQSFTRLEDIPAEDIDAEALQRLLGMGLVPEIPSE